MRGPKRMLPAVAACTVAVCTVSAGCGIRPTGIISAGAPPSAQAHPATITVYLVREGRLVPVSRPGLPGRPFLAVEQLAVPPTRQERALGLHTEVYRKLKAWVADQAGQVGRNSQLVVWPDDAMNPWKKWSRPAMAQIACTAQALPGVDGVRLTGTPDTGGNGWATVTCDEFSDLLGPVSRG